VNTQPSPLSYTVWRDGYPVASVDASLNTWINTGLVNGHSYKYFVSGVYEGDIHTSGIQIVSAVPAVQEFLPPTDLVGIVTEDDVNLSWNAPAAPFLTGFKVFRDGVLLNTINSPGLLTYTDLNVPNATYIYGVAATYQGGESGPTQIWVTVDYTSADDPSAPQLLTELFAASPNPARRSTELSFRLADAGIAELSIYNLKGQLVRKLLSGSITKGYHSVDWDGRDALGQAVAPGIYIFQLKTAGKVLRKKLTLTL
ncbi:MAG TPA: FlgD immunoglobulin-like domain containing protein, partial [Candidatus Cloacimonadota bacterium]|nr:FlgD immunoglobulin-like domain containing protein [Candidatus Cloacimonadota bacterium]